MIHFTYYKKEVLIVWPGATHALIGVKLNPQVYSVQKSIPAKFHPELSTFGSTAPEKPFFGLQ